MIYQFPDRDTLHLAITSGTVPTDVSMAPASACEFDEGHVWLQPSVALSRKAQNGLRRLGVEVVKAEGNLQAEELICWPQMLPIVRDPAAPPPTPQTPVLFELPDAEQLPDLVAEMLRLGNDRQSFRFLKEDKASRVLLRVVGPPYYSLLRALEHDGDRPAPIAYVERAPRLWVELGYTYPLVEHFKLPEGKMLLLRPPRHWTILDEAPFQDIYEILDFTLPAAPVNWKEAKGRARIKMPLRLAPSGSTEPAELWVVREQAVDQIDALVRDADDQLIQRLSFAVADHDGQTSIVVRVRPSKQAPPVVVLKHAQAFRPFLKLPNLFLPVGGRLQPPLRRDAVRQHLASDPDRITWLWPHDDGSFTPESLNDAAFRPLHDWVDYILDREQQALLTWMQSFRFDFQSFVCSDDEKPDAPKAPPRERKGGPKGQRDDTGPGEAAPPTQPAPKKGRRKDATADFAVLPQAEPNELQLRLKELEQQFLDHDGPLDAQERLALWPEIATVYTALGQSSDAAVCWMNALWETEAPPRDWAALWLHAEHVPGREASGEAIDRLLAEFDPPVSDVRSLVACIIGAVAAGTAAEVLGPRLNPIRQYLEKNESRVGVRAVWLAWVSLARLSAGDVLGLARARDRLLERLLSGGLNTEADLPSFLRFAGQQSSERFRVVRDHLPRLRELAHLWIDQHPINYFGDTPPVAPAEATKAYADLIFAFGFARLGESSGARELQAVARDALAVNDEAHSFLLQAYTYRIQQLLEGKPHGGPLPQEHLEYLADLMKKPAGGSYNREVYFIDRLRCHSRILEPQEKVDPYRLVWASDELNRELLSLSSLTDREAIGTRLGKLMQATKETARLTVVLKTAMELAPRVSESFTIDVLKRLEGLLDALGTVQGPHELESRASLIERALFLAAHFDRTESVQGLVARFLQLVESQSAEGPADALEGLTQPCGAAMTASGRPCCGRSCKSRPAGSTSGAGRGRCRSSPRHTSACTTRTWPHRNAPSWPALMHARSARRRSNWPFTSSRKCFRNSGPWRAPTRPIRAIRGPILRSWRPWCSPWSATTSRRTRARAAGWTRTSTWCVAASTATCGS